MTNNTSANRRTYLTVLSVGAAAALALSACQPDDTTEDAGDAEEMEQQESPDTADDAAGEETEDAGTEDTGAEDAETDAAAEDETDAADEADPADETEGAEADGEHPVYQAIDAALAEYQDGVITEFEDNTSDGGYVEVFVYDGETEWELEVDSESFEIIDTEDDGIDDDDREEAEAAEIDISEALQTAETESDGEPHEGELDTEDGTVVWQFEMTNDVEVYVDVTNGDVVKVEQ